jgi:hypothetical protein
MPINIPVKIAEQSPVQSLVSGVYALGEEASATVTSTISSCSGQDSIETHDDDDCPLILKAVSTVIATGRFVIEVLWDTLIDCGRFLFNLIAPFIGQARNTGNVSQAAIDATVNYRINRAKMSELPQDVAISANDLRNVYFVELARIPGDPEEEDAQPTLIDTVTQQYTILPDRNADTLRLLTECANYILNGLDELRVREEQRRQASQVGLPDPGEHPKKFEYEEMERMWMQIGYQMRDGNLAPMRKINLFGKLVDAMRGCGPHKYKGVKRGFEIVIGGTLDQKFLYWIKDFKREVILQRYQDGQFHVENDALDKVRDWGLGGDKAELSDVYKGMFGVEFSGLNYRYVLNREVTPARLVEMIKMQLEAEDSSEAEIAGYLQKTTSELPEGWDSLEYNEEYRLPERPRDPALTRPNHRLIAWVLADMGFFDEVSITL